VRAVARASKVRGAAEPEMTARCLHVQAAGGPLWLAAKFSFLEPSAGSVELGDEIRPPTQCMIVIDAPA